MYVYFEFIAFFVLFVVSITEFSFTFTTKFARDEKNGQIIHNFGCLFASSKQCSNAKWRGIVCFLRARRWKSRLSVWLKIRWSPATIYKSSQWVNYCEEFDRSSMRKNVIIHFIVFEWLVSRPAPHFEGTAVINGEFTQLSLNDYLGKYVVFFFYPLDL